MTDSGGRSASTLWADPLTCETGVEGVFAGGRAVSGPATVIQALAHGRRAAESARRFLVGEDLSKDREPPGPRPLLWTLEIDEAERQRRERTPVMLQPFNGPGLSESRARQEAERCLDCGAGSASRTASSSRRTAGRPKELARRVLDRPRRGLDAPDGLLVQHLLALRDGLPRGAGHRGDAARGPARGGTPRDRPARTAPWGAAPGDDRRLASVQPRPVGTGPRTQPQAVLPRLRPPRDGAPPDTSRSTTSCDAVIRAPACCSYCCGAAGRAARPGGAVRRGDRTDSRASPRARGRRSWSPPVPTARAGSGRAWTRSASSAPGNCWPSTGAIPEANGRAPSRFTIPAPRGTPPRPTPRSASCWIGPASRSRSRVLRRAGALLRSRRRRRRRGPGAAPAGSPAGRADEAASPMVTYCAGCRPGVDPGATGAAFHLLDFLSPRTRAASRPRAERGGPRRDYANRARDLPGLQAPEAAGRGVSERMKPREVTLHGERGRGAGPGRRAPAPHLASSGRSPSRRCATTNG